MGQNQKQPSKPVRADMEHRSREPRPAPDMKQVRRELGFDLIEMEREEQRRRSMR